MRSVDDVTNARDEEAASSLFSEGCFLLSASAVEDFKREGSCVFAARVPTDGADEEEESFLLREGRRSRLEG